LDISCSPSSNGGFEVLVSLLELAGFGIV